MVADPGLNVFRQILESFAMDQIHLTSARSSGEITEAFVLRPHRCERFPSRYPTPTGSSASRERDEP